jgi:hypothetical protein
VIANHFIYLSIIKSTGPKEGELNQERLANQELILINDDDQALIQPLNEGGRIGKIVDLKVARDAGKKTGSKRKCRDEVENRKGGKKQKPPPS